MSESISESLLELLVARRRWDVVSGFAGPGDKTYYEAICSKLKGVLDSHEGYRHLSCVVKVELLNWYIIDELGEAKARRDKAKGRKFYNSVFNQYIDDHLDRFSELITLFGAKFPQRERDLMKETFTLFTIFGSVTQQLKYAIYVVYNKFRHYKEMPENKEWFVGELLFPLSLRRVFNKLRSEALRHKMTSMELMETLVQGFKKGLLPVLPHQVENQLVGNFKDLTTPREPLEEDLADRMEELLNEMPFQFRNPVVRDVSRKATVEFSNSEGGSLAWVCERIGSDLPRPFLLIGYKQLQDWRVEPVHGPYHHINELASEFDAYSERPMQVIPCSVLEPMKVRIITKPTAGVYPLFTGIQKSLWQDLQEFPHFQLTGEPVKRCHLWNIVHDWLPGKFFNSGDFSQATDKMKLQVSRAIVNRLCNTFDMTRPWLTRLIRKSLLEAELLHSQSKKPKGFFSNKFSFTKLDEDGVQENGQLMGHNLSFPILCIANYLAFHISVERRYKMQFRPFKLPVHVLINGDDILFCGDMELINIWKSVTHAFGFEPSAGKSYVSDEFFQINSESWIPKVSYKFHPLDQTFEGLSLTKEDKKILTRTEGLVVDLKKVHYVNFGLLTGRGKAKSEEQEFRYGSPGRLCSGGAIYQQLVHGLNPRLAARATSLFSYSWRHEFQSPICSWKHIIVPGIDLDPLVHDYLARKEFAKQKISLWESKDFTEFPEYRLVPDLNSIWHCEDISLSIMTQATNRVWTVPVQDLIWTRC